ncbi:DUF2927 domain-containing protein [Marinomonas atlantica]|uniref:DUF2927 domain-containing protein n=1 Tax=Marinomonas atlantica TaxID=1806668 RepID=UPI0008323FEF|nr:DUF2927 domain-containing protein [Marinomonas atlantica]
MSHSPRARHYIFVVVLTLFTSIAHSAGGKSHWQERQYIQDSFKVIALQREYDTSKPARLVRWQKPIMLYFESEQGDSKLQARLLSTHAQHLSRITGVPIYFSSTRNNADIFAIFTSRENMENKVRRYIGDPKTVRRALDEAVCLGNFGVNRAGEIQRGVIIIPVNYARQRARLLDCVVEEITQLMGLPNDSNKVYPSIFNDISSDIYLSPLDFILLKMLYSPRFKAGMSSAQVEQALPSVMDDLYYLGIIDNAASLVQEGSLKRYLGD